MQKLAYFDAKTITKTPLPDLQHSVIAIAMLWYMYAIHLWPCSILKPSVFKYTYSYNDQKDKEFLVEFIIWNGNKKISGNVTSSHIIQLPDSFIYFYFFLAISDVMRKSLRCSKCRKSVRKEVEEMRKEGMKIDMWPLALCLWGHPSMSVQDDRTISISSLWLEWEQSWSQTLIPFQIFRTLEIWNKLWMRGFSKPTNSFEITSVLYHPKISSQELIITSYFKPKTQEQLCLCISVCFSFVFTVQVDTICHVRLWNSNISPWEPLFRMRICRDPLEVIMSLPIMTSNRIFLNNPSFPLFPGGWFTTIVKIIYTESC